VVNANEDVLLLAAELFGQGDHLPAEWEPYIRRFVADATGASGATRSAGSRPTTSTPASARRPCARWSSAT
jgi:hypothetical protein